MYIYFWQWIVSWQICVASLPESVTWVYSRFHRWCNNAWEDGRITSAKCATNLCNMFFKKHSIKLRLLSRTWPNISKLEHTVLILRPSMFIAAVVKQLVPASLNAWRHRTASVQKGANGWKWPKQKNTGKTKKKQFSESLGWDTPLQRV